jgi:hypothetical protein
VSDFLLFALLLCFRGQIVVLYKNKSSWIAWRWPNSVAETCSYKYNKPQVKIVLVVLTLYTHTVYIWLLQHKGNGMHKCKDWLER